MNKKTTPRPWKVIIRPAAYGGQVYVYEKAEDETEISGFIECHGRDREANAALIVKCVNMHEKLLESLKVLCHELDINYMDDEDSYAGPTVKAVNKMLKKAQALLAKADADPEDKNYNFAMKSEEWGTGE